MARILSEASLLLTINYEVMFFRYLFLKNVESAFIPSCTCCWLINTLTFIWLLTVNWLFTGPSLWCDGAGALLNCFFLSFLFPYFSELCRSLDTEEEAILDNDGSTGHRKPPRKERKKLLSSYNSIFFLLLCLFILSTPESSLDRFDISIVCPSNTNLLSLIIN